MAFSSNPKISTDDLVLVLDAADISSARTLREVEVMVVGGGGGGGMDMGGGGGGGGVVYNPNFKVTPGTVISVTVGAGGYGAPTGGGYRTDGAGPQPNFHQFTVRATNGGDSAFGTLVAKGGGYGASSYYGYLPDSGIGGTGASGGGCSGYTHGGERYVDSNNLPGQGYPGGNSGDPSNGNDNHYSGGGGGAGGRGTSGPNHVAPSGVRGHGGPGVIIPRMSPYYYGGGGGGAGHTNGGGNGGLGGGGGGSDCSGAGIGVGDTNGRNAGVNGNSGCSQPGGNGGANTGGGGGGGTHYNTNNKGGEGGSGIVIVRYNGLQAASGGTYSFENGVSFHTFTSNGEFVPYSTHTTWYDLSGRNNHASLENGISHSYLNGGTMILDGTNDVILAPSVNSFGGIPNHTFEMWVKSPGLGPGKSVGGLFCPDYGMITYIAGDGNIVYYLYNSSTSSYVSSIGTSGVNMFDNQWHHLAFTRANYEPARIYVDGVLKVSSGNTGDWPGTTAWSGMNIQIGNNPNDAYYHLLGNIAVAKMYKRALSASEVLRNYNITKSRFGK